MTQARLGPRSLRAAPYPAIQLLEDRLSVLGALLVIANLPELFGGKCIQACGDLFHGQLVVALDGKPGVPHALLGVGDGDVEQLGVAAHDLLGHLLEGLLLLLGLLLEALLLLLGLLHPPLGPRRANSRTQQQRRRSVSTRPPRATQPPSVPFSRMLPLRACIPLPSVCPSLPLFSARGVPPSKY